LAPGASSAGSGIRSRQDPFCRAEAGLWGFGNCKGKMKRENCKSADREAAGSTTVGRRSGLHIVLVEPEIPPNTGNIARLCAATFTPLHLVGKLGFRTDHKAVRRAGLDYWDEVDISYHLDLEALYASLPQHRFLYFTTKASRAYTEARYMRGDC